MRPVWTHVCEHRHPSQAFPMTWCCQIFITGMMWEPQLPLKQNRKFHPTSPHHSAVKLGNLPQRPMVIQKPDKAPKKATFFFFFFEQFYYFKANWILFIRDLTIFWMLTAGQAGIPSRKQTLLGSSERREEDSTRLSTLLLQSGTSSVHGNHRRWCLCAAQQCMQGRTGRALVSEQHHWQMLPFQELPTGWSPSY